MTLSLVALALGVAFGDADTDGAKQKLLHGAAGIGESKGIIMAEKRRGGFLAQAAGALRAAFPAQEKEDEEDSVASEVYEI